MIPMLDISRELSDIGGEIRAAVESSISATRYIMGPNVSALEDACANYLGTTSSLGVASGTDALHLALRAAGVCEGDEVITTPFTFIATAEAIAYCGAVPVFVDVKPDTMNIDPEAIAAAITPKTRAVIPVHLFGNPADMDDIMAIAKKHDLKVIEDCAQSFGSTYKGKQTGSFGDASCFSFFPSKNLGCYGDGGLIATSDPAIDAEVKRLRNHGSDERYIHSVIGYNSRLDDIQAAILNVKLKHIDRFNEDRRGAAKMYRDLIGESVGYQKETDGGVHVYHQYTLVSPKRDAVLKNLAANDIAGAVYYPIPLHMQKAFSGLGYKPGSLPVAEKLAEEVFSLPINPYLEDEEIQIIAHAVKTAIGG